MRPPSPMLLLLLMAMLARTGGSAGGSSGSGVLSRWPGHVCTAAPPLLHARLALQSCCLALPHPSTRDHAGRGRQGRSARHSRSLTAGRGRTPGTTPPKPGDRSWRHLVTSTANRVSSVLTAVWLWLRRLARKLLFLILLPVVKPWKTKAKAKATSRKTTDKAVKSKLDKNLSDKEESSPKRKKKVSTKKKAKSVTNKSEDDQQQPETEGQTKKPTTVKTRKERPSKSATDSPKVQRQTSFRTVAKKHAVTAYNLLARFLRYAIVLKLDNVLHFFLFYNVVVLLGTAAFCCLLLALLTCRWRPTHGLWGHVEARLAQMAQPTRSNSFVQAVAASVATVSAKVRLVSSEWLVSYLVIAIVTWRWLLVAASLTYNSLLSVAQHVCAKVFFRVRKPFVFFRAGVLSMCVSVSFNVYLTPTCFVFPRVNIVSVSLRLTPGLSVCLCLSLWLSLYPMVTISFPAN